MVGLPDFRRPSPVEDDPSIGIRRTWDISAGGSKERATAMMKGLGSRSEADHAS